jgi:uncharacterized membrane protein
MTILRRRHTARGTSLDDSQTAPPTAAGPEDGKPAAPRRRWWSLHVRRHFLAGVLVTAPVGITFYIVWLIVTWVDGKITPLIPPVYNPGTYLPFPLPGLGLLIVFVVLTVTGALTTGLVGRFLLRLGERAVARMPFVRSVYGAIKQIFETVLAQQSSAFREVVLVEYPRRGIWAIGFITGVTEGEVQEDTEDDVVNVFLPTTPNPTSGFLLFVPRKDLVVLSMSVEEGIKMVVSGGIVTPPDRRPPEVRRASRGIVSKERPEEPARTPKVGAR